jgi:transcriptional regulator with XRE-family HTH domain
MPLNRTPHPLDESDPRECIGSRIRAWRIHRKLSQRTVSIDVGVSQVAISQYESGRREPSTLMLLRVARAMDVRPDRLVLETPELSE